MTAGAAAPRGRLQLFANCCTLATMADVTKSIRDAGYVTIGLGVLAFQRAQVRRRELGRQLEAQRGELRRQLDLRRHDLETQVSGFRTQLDLRRQDLETQVSGLRTQVAERTREIEQRFEPVVGQIEGQLDRLEERLPDQARGVVRQARHQAAGVRTQLHDALTAGSSPGSPPART